MRTIVEHLACIPLHAHSTNIHERVAGERAVCSLRLAVQRLRDFYKVSRPFAQQPSNAPPQSCYPFRNYYHVGERKYEFVYMEAVENKRVFRAHLRGSEETKLYIKFTQRYSEAAHRAAYQAKLTPELIAIEDVYEWKIVVVADISSDYVLFWNLDSQSDRAKARNRASVVVKAIHQLGFVHGDVRDVNIMVRRGDTEDVKIIDWDWAGVLGETTYPYNMNKTTVVRPEGVERGGKIQPEHDLSMVHNLRLLPGLEMQY